MSSLTQPDLINDNGCVLTVGIVSGVDRCAIVLPVATDNESLDALTLCNDAVGSFVDNVLVNFCQIMCGDAYVSYVAADGMIDDRVPVREDFAPTDHPGTRTGAVMSSQVAALMVFYRDPTHALGTPRMRVAKNFIPGISEEDVTGDLISSGLATAIQTVADALQNGYASSDNGAKKWYRYLATPKERTPGTHLIPTTGQINRRYVATQRRRLIPR